MHYAITSRLASLIMIPLFKVVYQVLVFFLQIIFLLINSLPLLDIYSYFLNKMISKLEEHNVLIDALKDSENEKTQTYQEIENECIKALERLENMNK